MTQRRKQKKNKKNKKSIQSDLSDTGSQDESTGPPSYTARGRTHQGGSLGNQVSDRALSTSNQSLVNRSLVIQSPVNQSPVSQSPVNQSPVKVTGHPVNGKPVTSYQSSSHRSTNHQLTSHRSTSHQSTSHQSNSQPGTAQPGTSHQSSIFDYQSPITDQFITSYSPVFVPQQSYAPSVSSYVSYASNRRLPNIQDTGYEHSKVKEFPNPAASSKQILPLEPDFSQMSDPSVIDDRTS